MATIIARDFSFAKDFRNIKWRPTLGYNLLRSACAGLVIGALMFFFPHSPQERMVGLVGPLVWMGGYLLFFLPFGLLLSALSSVIPFAGLISFFLAVVAVSIGDPFVCLIKAIFPRWVSVEAPSLFSLYLIIFILDVEEISISS